MYAIAKPAAAGGARFYVTRIIGGGRLIDNCRVEDGRDPWQARRFRTQGAADSALAGMVREGGYDDYEVVPL